MGKNDLFDRLANDFTYHPPGPGQPAKYEQIRATAHVLARLLVGTVPEGLELETALARLNETVFWANAGIARGAE